jgi:hypothetical protein
MALETQQFPFFVSNSCRGNRNCNNKDGDVHYFLRTHHISLPKVQELFQRDIELLKKFPTLTIEQLGILSPYSNICYNIDLSFNKILQHTIQ